MTKPCINGCGKPAAQYRKTCETCRTRANRAAKRAAKPDEVLGRGISLMRPSGPAPGGYAFDWCLTSEGWVAAPYYKCEESLLTSDANRALAREIVTAGLREEPWAAPESFSVYMWRSAKNDTLVYAFSELGDVPFRSVVGRGKKGWWFSIYDGSCPTPISSGNTKNGLSAMAYAYKFALGHIQTYADDYARELAEAQGPTHDDGTPFDGE